MAEPWIPHVAREYLEGLIKPDWSCFEWGSGGSTLWLAERCAKVISVEHDESWWEKTKSYDAHVWYVPPEVPELGPDPANPAHYRSYKRGGINFKKYASFVDGFKPFDLILVDGRARASCLAHAAPKVKPGGYLGLDNAERAWYTAWHSETFDDWERVWFQGHGPRLDYPWQFVLWRKSA